MNLGENNLKQVQIWIAILAGVVTFIVGAYNIKNIISPKKDESSQVTSSRDPNPVRSALEDVGAEWIKKWGKPGSSASNELNPK